MQVAIEIVSVRMEVMMVMPESKLKIYNLVINEDTKEFSLVQTDGDGNIKGEVGLRDAKDLLEGVVDKIDKRLEKQKLDTRSVLGTDPAYPYGYPDAILQEG
ncbi:MAG: hypothetical protein Q8N61_01580 [bacterium]|nr:hypothetical protein [bacterium]